jgi:adenosylhomocysteine nucleosidase
MTQNKSLAPIGIMSAMPQEADSILEAMTEKTVIKVGLREFTLGFFEKTPVVFSLSGIGKVSAAMTATLLIEKFKARELIFTGVAGGSGETNVGDIVVGHSYLQHDLDLRPIAPSFYIYSLEKQILEASTDLISRMRDSASEFLSKGISFPDLNIFDPKVYEGVIVSGDQFINSKAEHQAISDKAKEVLPNGFHAVEMEGAAVAQVCTELQTPFIILRTISDKADESASIDFSIFMDQVARHYSLGVLEEYFQCNGMK